MQEDFCAQGEQKNVQIIMCDHCFSKKMNVEVDVFFQFKILT